MAGLPHRASEIGSVSSSRSPRLEWLLASARVRWLLACALDGLAAGTILGALSATALPGRLAVALSVGMAAALALTAIRGFTRWPSAEQLVLHLNTTSPELTWSSELLLARPEQVSPVAAVQRGRVEQALERLADPVWPTSRLRRPALRFVGALLLAVLVWLAAHRIATPAALLRSLPRPAAPAATSLRTASTVVEPPRYTRHPNRTTSDWSVRAEEGARVRFAFAFDGPIDRVVMRFGRQDNELRETSSGWLLERSATRSELYSVVGWSGEHEVFHGRLGRLEVIPDQPPTIEVVHPGPLTLVAEPVTGSLNLEVTARDDYGIAGVEARLVLAKGLGEGVTFREQRRPLETAGGGRYVGRLDLASLGLAQDVEVFLRFEVRDNREPNPNRTQTPVVRIRLVRPEEKLSVSLAAGLALPPILALFRSERQIIIDTEQLLRDKPHLAAAEFQKRAESIGFDQHALRLRYGALLGEEVESGVAVDAAKADVDAARRATGAKGATGPSPEPKDDDEQHPRATSSLGSAPTTIEALAAQLPAGMVHLHDSIETATFLPEPLRQEMRTVLNNMWQAEGHLRSIDPRGALPYENLALNQLKDVQQRARVYVAKVGYQPPELDPTRRLKGEMDGISDRHAELPGPPSDQLLELFTWTEQACSGARPPAPPALAAAAAEEALNKAALAGNDRALHALEAWRGTAQPGCREAQALSAALWGLLRIPPPPIERADGQP
jgi:hypothetical protein